MKNKIIITVIALMSTQAFAADLRDASFKVSSNATKITIAQGQSSVDGTMKAADFTGEKLDALLSKRLASTAKSSASIGRSIIQVSQVSKPVFKLTGKGLAMVFKLSGQSADQSLNASKKLILLLDPSSKASGRALEFIFDKLSDGSEISSDVSSKILKPLSKGTEISSDVSTEILKVLAKVFAKPLDLTSDAIGKISEILFKASSKGSEISTKVTGKNNLDAGLELTGNGISLTSKGIGAIFYFISKGTTGITELFDLNKEEIQKAVERNDQDTLAGLRDLIRAEINKSIEGGEVINQLLTDEDLDLYVELRLSVSIDE
ncbi:MAG: hypothetical protein PHY93_15710 [Bacteriovorax sp.]|nr:hypothetical protein [Bacteriovorax sp.]